MSNPDSSTPSIQARNLAVKPAGFQSWDEFCTIYHRTGGVNAMALAYAADLDKADKVGRMVQAVGMIYTPQELFELQAAARGLRLPDPEPTLWDEYQHAHRGAAVSTSFSDGAKYALDWITKRELAKEQDRG